MLDFYYDCFFFLAKMWLGPFQVVCDALQRRNKPMNIWRLKRCTWNVSKKNVNMWFFFWQRYSLLCYSFSWGKFDCKPISNQKLWNPNPKVKKSSKRRDQRPKYVRPTFKSLKARFPEDDHEARAKSNKNWITLLLIRNIREPSPWQATRYQDLFIHFMVQNAKWIFFKLAPS